MAASVGGWKVARADIRSLIGRAYSGWWRLRTARRITGASFILRKPCLVRIARGASLRIGRGVVIERGARIVVTASLTIGDGVYIGKNSTLVGFGDIYIGERTLIGENVSVHTEDHGPAGRRDSYVVSDVRIGSDAWIGAGVVVTRGADVGDRSTIGALSLVRGAIPSDVLAAGAPATVRRRLDVPPTP